MTTLIDDNRVRIIAADSTRYFYFYMALSCSAVAFLGFAPTYFMPLAKGSLSATPVIHAHGIVFFAWSLFFVFQSWLAASGRLTRHRSVGMIGISLATAMTIFGFLVAVSAMKRSAAIGQTDEGIAFAIVPFTPPVIVTIPPAFIAYLLLVAAMVFDWRTRGRPHQVYVIGGIALIAVKLLNLPISTSHAWHSLAGGILALAQ
jgi:hypothetical protein